MGCGERSRYDEAITVDQNNRFGPETVALMSVLVQGFSLLASLLHKVIDQEANLAILRSPDAFSFIKTPNSVSVTPGTAIEIAANKSNESVVVYVRAETYAPGISSHLILDTEVTRTTLARARLVKYSVAPEAIVLLEANQKLYADVTDSSGGLQATFSVTATVMQLSGQSAF